jgi:DNA-binding transcriptional regulator YhcF (GntR family)
MIRIWLSREGPTPIREQLSAQLLLGILSGQLAGGARLPSVREFARRLKIHRNTVSAVYQDLEARGWLELRAGSGVYVTEGRAERLGGVDAFARLWADQARAHGYTVDDLRAALDRLADTADVHERVVVDPDPELARIIAAELEEAIGEAVPFSGLDERPRASLLLVSEGNAGAVAARWPDARLRLLRLKSVPELVAGIQRPPFPVLIGLVSHSPSILQWARTLLSALGFPPDQVLLRNPAEAGWSDGLRACAIVAADVVAAREFAADGPRPMVFRVVTQESLDALRGLVPD